MELTNLEGVLISINIMLTLGLFYIGLLLYIKEKENKILREHRKFLLK